MRSHQSFHRALLVVGRLLAPAMLALAALPTPAQACSCARNPTAQGLLASSAVVFTGVAEASDKPRGTAVTSFKVTESFKGTRAGATVRISHYAGPSATCGVEFAPGETYTVAADATTTPGLYSTSLCGTWMFLPHVGLSERLLKEMRALAQHPERIASPPVLRPKSRPTVPIVPQR